MLKEARAEVVMFKFSARSNARYVVEAGTCANQPDQTLRKRGVNYVVFTQ